MQKGVKITLLLSMDILLIVIKVLPNEHQQLLGLICVKQKGLDMPSDP